MPDAIITATASTFGTITGTFAADQSTITGTVSGVITGTLTGSVGVPGPQGPQGIQGPAGPEGPPGEGGTWGSIVGTISAQGDLWTELQSKLPLAGGTMSGTLFLPTIRNLLNQNLVVDAYNDTGAGTHNYFNFNPFGGGFELPASSSGIKFGDNTVQSTAAVTFNPTGYATESWVTAGFYPLTGNPSGFLTAASLSGYATESWVTGQGYITSAALSPYLLSSTAASTYYLQTNPAGYQTAAQVTSALSPYLTSATAASTYQTLSGMSAYLTTATAASTYQTLAGMSSYLTTAAAAAGYYPLTGNPSGFLTSAPVTSVAGRTGAITLSNTDISGLGTMATASASNYSTTAVADTLYAPIAAGLPTGGTVGQILTKQSGTNFDASFQTLIPGDRYLTSSTTSLTINNANKTLTVGTGLSYTTQQDVIIAYDAAHHMHARVTAYNSSTGQLDVDVISHTGTGTFASWTVNVGGTVPVASIVWGDITGTLGNQTDLATALSNKLETSTAASTYYLQTNPSGFITSSALTGYATESWVTSQGYITSAALTGYATESWVTAGFYPLTGNPSGFLTSAPVTSVAGRTGAVTLANTDISGLGTLSTVNEAPADGSTYGRNNGSWVVAGGVSLSGNNTWTGTNSFNNGNGTFGNSTSGGTINISNGLISTGSQTVNIGQNGQAGSTTTINIGTTSQGGLCTINTAGALVLNAGGGSNTSAPLRFGSSATPTTFTDGDVWYSSGALFFRRLGVSQQLALLGLGQTFTGNNTFSGTSTFSALVSTPASTATSAGFRIVAGAAPTTPVSGDVWITTGAAGVLTFRGPATVQTVATLGYTQTFSGTNTFSGATLTFGNSTAASTTNVATGATLAATAKTVNIGTNGVSTSTTTVNVGSAVSGATSTINLNGTVNAAGLANGVKAWVNFNGTGTPAIRASYNVSSITDNGVGDYTVNFTAALADANYAVAGFAGDALFSTGVQIASWGTYTQTTSAFRLKSSYGATTIDTTHIHAVFIR